MQQGQTPSIYSTLSGVMPAGLQDVEQVRIILRGDSVIDWERLAFRDRKHVNAFLALHGFVASDPQDAVRLAWIHQEALGYAEQHLKLRFGEAVRQISDVRELLLMASRSKDDARRDACVLLKIMHVIHHATGRELLHCLPVPMNELFRRIEARVFEAVDDMKAAGVEVVGFAASRKSSESVFTKLLARTDNLAAEVHDRLRFRVVTKTLDDLFTALLCLTRWVIPFNYVLPGESRNDLIDLGATMAADPRLRRMRGLLQRLPGLDDRPGSRVNWFSSSGFRMINFVADIPVKVHDLVQTMPDHEASQGRVVFLLAEFQLVDEATARNNESGENRHELYKSRQHARVVDRLTGMAHPS